MSPTSRNHPYDLPVAGAGTERPPRRLGTRMLGWTLMTLTLGLVSCQSLFVL